MKEKVKLFGLILLTFIVSLSIVLFTATQLLTRIPEEKVPLEKAGISNKEMFLATLGYRVPEEKQKIYQKYAGEPFYSSDHDGVAGLLSEDIVFLPTAVAMTAVVVALIRMIARKRRSKRLYLEETNKQREHIEKYAPSPDCFQVSCLDSLNYNPSIAQTRLLLWFEDQFVHMISANHRYDIGKLTVSYRNIGFFSRYGDMFTSTDIYEKTPPFSQAFLGYMIGGGVGAVIASKGEIASRTRVHDKRETILHIKEDGQEVFLFFDPNTYNILMHQIPDKEISLASKTAHRDQSEDLYEKLMKLGELNDKGYISEEEFKRLKDELLKSTG